jgi:hypothetical protein
MQYYINIQASHIPLIARIVICSKIDLVDEDEEVHEELHPSFIDEVGKTLIPRSKTARTPHQELVENLLE